MATLPQPIGYTTGDRGMRVPVYGYQTVGSGRGASTQPITNPSQAIALGLAKPVPSKGNVLGSIPTAPGASPFQRGPALPQWANALPIDYRGLALLPNAKPFSTPDGKTVAGVSYTDAKTGKTLYAALGGPGASAFARPQFTNEAGNIQSYAFTTGNVKPLGVLDAGVKTTSIPRGREGPSETQISGLGSIPVYDVNPFTVPGVKLQTFEKSKQRGDILGSILESGVVQPLLAGAGLYLAGPAIGNVLGALEAGIAGALGAGAGAGGAGVGAGAAAAPAVATIPASAELAAIGIPSYVAPAAASAADVAAMTGMGTAGLGSAIAGTLGSGLKKAATNVVANKALSAILGGGDADQRVGDLGYTPQMITPQMLSQQLIAPQFGLGTPAEAPLMITPEMLTPQVDYTSMLRNVMTAGMLPWQQPAPSYTQPWGTSPQLLTWT